MSSSKKISQGINNWRKLWFESFSFSNYRLFQILFCFTVFVMYFCRFFQYELLFTDQGILPFNKIQELPESFHDWLPWEYLTIDPLIGKILYIFFLLGLVSVIFNFQSRTLLILLFILHTAFIKRNPIAVYGADMVASFWFLYMILASPNAKASWSKQLSSVSFRLIQIQLCIIYAYSGFDKLKGNTWWQGDALWFAYANSQQTSLDFSFLIHVPWLVVILSYITVLWEVYFPVLIWYRPIKKYVLFIGLIFHIMIALSMNLLGFSLLMLSTYFLFLDDKRANRYYQKLIHIGQVIKRRMSYNGSK